jgi:hypothetical protein
MTSWFWGWRTATTGWALSPASAISSWHADIASGSEAKACDLMTTGAQTELVAVSGDATCVAALDEALLGFTTTDKAGFEAVQVDTSKIEIQGDVAAVASGAVTYPDGVAEVLKFRREIDLTKVNGSWLLDSVIEDDLNH